MKNLFFLLLFPLVATGQDETRELNTYIEMLHLKPLPQAAHKREALFKLGRRLFHDKKLSGKQNISCHHCHSEKSFSADTLPLGVGEGSSGHGHNRQQDQGLILARHTPALFNLGFSDVSSFFWDGRVARHSQGGWVTPEVLLNGPNPIQKEIAQTLDSLLAAQALFPLASPEEMLGKESTLTKIEAWQEVMTRLFEGRGSESYRKLFQEAFPNLTHYNIGHVGNALAEFQRHQFLANDTPWDRYLKGDKSILTKRMKRGANLFFGKAMCVNCHTGVHFTSFGFQNVVIPHLGPGVAERDDKGRFEVTKNPDAIYRFRVSPLRNTALTAPYMHNGYLGTMKEVINHYDHPMRSLHHPNWNPKHPRYREDLSLDQRPETNSIRAQTMASNLPRFIRLSSEEKDDLYCFLMVALTDMKYQKELNKGIMDETNDCPTLPHF